MTPIKISLTPEQFAAKAKSLKDQGVSIEGTQGTISHSGVILDWNYDGQTLLVSVLKKPWVISEGSVESKIRGWFA